MNDLNVIHRQNAKASESVISDALKLGKHVVAIFSGLNFHTHKEFATREEAESSAPGLTAQLVGAHFKIHSPSAAA